MTQQIKWENRIVSSGTEDPEQLLANPLNFRRHPAHQKKAMTGVLSEIGWIQDVIVNKVTGHIIDGHLRVELAMQRSEKVPVKYVELSEHEEKIALASIDPIGALAEQDQAMLDDLIEDIGTVENDDLSAFLDSMLSDGPDMDEAEEEGLIDDDECPDAPAESVIKPGDVFILGDHRVICGDSTNMDDIDKLMAGEQADIAQRARDVRAGESAFGSRARLGAEERTEALGRGLSETLGRLRSQGFQQAQQTALGEFGREQQRLANLASGIGSLAQTRQAGQVGFGQQLMGLGTQQQQAQQADIQRQLGLGQLTQAQQQRQLDAARANALMQQQAPLQQMQSLLPFVQSVPAGFSQIGTQFGVLPSPLQTGLGVGLSALGGLGSFFNPPQYRGYPTATTKT